MIQEKQCRFCKQDLPSWKAAFADLSTQPQNAHVPVMSIQFNGQKYWLEVRPGTGGVEQFKEDVRKLLGLHADQAFDITFECRVPIPLAGNSKLELQGLQAYDAAVYCASLTAAQRKHRTSSPGPEDKRFVWSSNALDSTNTSPSTHSTISRSSTSGSTVASDPDIGPLTCDDTSRGFLSRHFSCRSRSVSMDGEMMSSSSSGRRRSSSTSLSVASSAGSDQTTEDAADSDSSGGSRRGSRSRSLGCARPCLVARLWGALRVLWHLSGDDVFL
eukprot:GHUV01009209.1.p1 GENE.GHUV01009209.1~~GHUV01009209.1.p1  ORF type:complete len:273 (+),score=60.58 GHUV01009209.1:694-1512(+)